MARKLEHSLTKVGALVAYKGKPAKIIASTTHKFELNFSDGTSQKVREKDFRYIHPLFSNIVDQCPLVDLNILNDLQDVILIELPRLQTVLHILDSQRPASI